MNTAEGLIKALENEGIRYIFGVPGEENLDILEAIRKSKKITFVVTRHEQAAGFMAATIGRMSGTPAVALSTLGPGATNLMTAAAYAQLGAMPFLMITGQKPIRHSKQGAFQIIDVVDMMKPLTKYSKQLVEGSMVFSSIREAVRLATEERPGAALLEIPEDIAEEEIKTQPISPSETRRPIAEEKAIIRAVDALRESKRPLILIGAGANRKRTSKMLTKLVSEYDIPFVDTQMGKGVIDESMPQFAGTAALSAGDIVHKTIEQADVMLIIGHDVVEKPPFYVQDHQRMVHINFESASVNDIYHPSIEVIGDIANAIWQIKEMLAIRTKKPDWDTSYHLSSKKELEETFAESVSETTKITPQTLVHSVRSVVPEDGIVALDNGMYKIWFARHYVTHHENTLLLDNALATMGAGLPAAMAAKLLHPEKAVVAVAGDGGFMMNSQELETAVRLKLNLVLIILNDKKLQMIRWGQEQKGFEDYGLDFSNPDFVAYAKSYGAHAYSATTSEELEQSIKTGLTSNGVHVIDVAMDYGDSSNKLKKN